MKKKIYREKYNENKIIDNMIRQTGAKIISVPKIDKIKDYKKESKKSE